MPFDKTGREISVAIRIKSLLHYANSKFKAIIFEVFSRTELLNVTIVYLNDSFSRVSQVMRRVQSSLRDSSARFVDFFRSGEGAIDDIYKRFSRIDDNFQASFQIASQLSEITKKAGRSLTQINSIASKTDILALNASIAATRAGEAGKGFAVLAEEIRNHAITTSRVVEAISSDITQLIDGINELTGKIDSMRNEVDKGREQIHSLVDVTSQEHTIVGAMTQDIEAMGLAFDEYEGIHQTLNRMITQSDASKQEIKGMLLVFQHDLELLEANKKFITPH